MTKNLTKQQLLDKMASERGIKMEVNPEQSKEVQEICDKLLMEVLNHYNAEYLYIKNMELTYSSNSHVSDYGYDYFNNHPAEEIQANEFIKIMKGN